MNNVPLPTEVSVAVVGGGQAGLAIGYYLRRAGMTPGDDFVIFDAGDRPGGAWRHMWDGLRLFSPATYSTLPGWMMPAWDEASHGFPPRDHVVDYLTGYERRYELGVRRPCRVSSVERDRGDAYLLVKTEHGDVRAKQVVSATGTWTQPFWPRVLGQEAFSGQQLHTAQYQRPQEFEGRHVVVVGGGNSAAQILAEISAVTSTTWVTRRPPRFLPDDVDGRALFAAATQRVRAKERGAEHPGVGGLGDIVMTPGVREAQRRHALEALPVFSQLTPSAIAWSDGTQQHADVVVWCTGFRPALRHLRPLHVTRRGGRIGTGGPAGTRSADQPRLHLAGYGDWTGAASATILGAGRAARDTTKVLLDQRGR